MSENGSVDEIKVEEFNNEAGQTVESGELSEGKKSFFLLARALNLTVNLLLARGNLFPSEVVFQQKVVPTSVIN